MLNYQFTNRNIVVHKNIDADIAKIWGDGPQLGQLLMNVLLNAQQALSGRGGDREIRIHASSVKASDSVAITITDNGPGIPEDVRHKVFQPFFTTKPEGRGTGLGLSLCKSVVEGHGGSITIEEVEPHGTKVVIQLPGSTGQVSDIHVRAHLAQTLNSMRILVVDDEESLASSIAEVLENCGHTVVTAGSAKQAMTHLTSDKFDIILADVHMPVTDGMAFYRQVQNLDADMADKFIFITGDSLDPELISFFDEQHRPYLNKPFEIGDLVRAIEKLALSSTHVISSANEGSERLRNV
jgi:CheY-like chemotaxis protein